MLSYLFTPREAKVHVNLDNSFITLPFTRIVDDAQLKISLVHETNKLCLQKRSKALPNRLANNFINQRAQTIEDIKNSSDRDNKSQPEINPNSYFTAR